MRLVVASSLSALTLTGCADFLNGAANLADKSRGISWPGAFVTVGVCACLAYALGKLFTSG